MTRERLAELWRYRELFYFFVWRDVKVRYKQTIIGAAWAILQPFLTMIVFSIFFGKLAKMPSDGIPYPIFSYSGLLPWTYFSTALSNAGNSMVSNSELITKVYFPRMIIPSSAVLSGLVDFSIACTMLGGMMIYYKIEFTLQLLLWPIFMLALVVLVTGLGMIIAALNVNYRDVKYALPFGIQLWLFFTPVIYPSSIVPEKFRFLLALNPLTGIIDACRACLLPTHSIDWRLFFISTAVAFIVLLIGIRYFLKTERTFADFV